MPNWLDEALKKAMESGSFDDLPGAGKPLKLDKGSAFEDPTWRMAHRVMKDHEVVPAWIAERQDIEQRLGHLLQSLSGVWQRRQDAPAQNWQAADQEWERALVSFREHIQKLNKRIFDFNLSVPVASMQLHHIEVEREIEKAKQ